jgi:hypothetical protein
MRGLPMQPDLGVCRGLEVVLQIKVYVDEEVMSCLVGYSNNALAHFLQF